MKVRKTGTTKVKNEDKISIYFSDGAISELFSQLIEGLGFQTELLSDITHLEGDTKIVTEPIYFPDLLPDQQRQCLLIGSPDALDGIDSLSIAQPLTETKIFGALEEFLEIQLQEH